MFRIIKEDIATVLAKDPAAKSIIEIILCYPGLHSIWLHRIAHWLYRKKNFVLARVVSHFNRFVTGIEIHPGAQIGRRLFIDHGMGVVMGETTEIGNDCLIYQGVVLGGTSLNKGKRHPTIGNRVVIGSGAAVLGPLFIGDGARIGAGSVVLRDVPANATVVGVPGRIGLGYSPDELNQLDHTKLPDPVADAVNFMLKEQDKLEDRLRKVEKMEGITDQIDEYWEKKKKEIKLEFFGADEKFTDGSGI